mmetsp:Transcript_156691/g.300541  ORF Transcript_156691/g.300541 Transcript_156691/m.300541 type:complete len:168 (-) Transcript_156691:177-680(-)
MQIPGKLAAAAVLLRCFVRVNSRHLMKTDLGMPQRVSLPSMATHQLEKEKDASSISLPDVSRFAMIQAASQTKILGISIGLIVTLLLICLATLIVLFYLRGGTTAQLAEHPIDSLGGTAKGVYRDQKDANQRARQEKAYGSFNPDGTLGPLESYMSPNQRQRFPGCC